MRSKEEILIDLYSSERELKNIAGIETVVELLLDIRDILLRLEPKKPEEGE